jgi:hypothetical protein
MAIVSNFKGELDEFHGLVDGRLIAIHDMLNTIGAGALSLSPPLQLLLLPAFSAGAQRSFASASARHDRAHGQPPCAERMSWGCIRGATHVPSSP